MKYMPWDKLENVPAQVRTHNGVPLTLEQANKWSEVFDALEGQEGIESPAAVAWATWNKLYKKSEDGKSWVKREKSLSMSLNQNISTTIILQSNAIESLLSKYPPVGDEKAWLVFRKKMGDDVRGWIVDELLIIDEPTEEILKDILWEGEFRLFPVHPDIGGVIGNATVDELPDGGIGFKIESEKVISPLPTDGEVLAVCPECNDDSCTYEKMFSVSVPKLHQLAEDEQERIGASELLLVYGTAIAEGEWKNVVFEEAVVKDALERATNLRIDVEHEDETWDDVKGFSYKPRWNEERKGIDIDGAIFDERVINWHNANPTAKLGFSVKLGEDSKFEFRDNKKYCTYLTFKGLALTLNPACKICWVDEMHTVQLNSLDDKSNGGNEMADKDKKTPEELAAEKKLADEKLAEEKKATDAKKLEDEKAKKLADDKAEEDKLAKPKEDAAPAKPAAADSKLSAELDKRFSDMETELKELKQANKTLHDERSLSDVNTMVNGLIESGQLSEAKREDATNTLLALSSNEDRAAFLNTIGGNWKAGEQGLVLSEEEKSDEEKEKDLELSEPERNVIT